MMGVFFVGAVAASVPLAALAGVAFDDLWMRRLIVFCGVLAYSVLFARRAPR